MVSVDDEVELSEKREGFVRYKGPLDGKNGIYYGIQLTKGVGKHNGLYKGKRYFMTQKGKAIFVTQKEILYKIQTKTKQTDKKKKKPKMSTSKSNPTNTSGKKFKVPRKTGPSQEKKASKKGGWKAPSWANKVLDDDGGGWQSEKRKYGGKLKKLDGKVYNKAGYLPHAKWKKKKYRPEEWDELQQENKKQKKKNDEARNRIKWEQDELDKQDIDGMNDKDKEEAERKRILLEEEEERIKNEEEARKRKLKEIEAERERIKQEEDEMNCRKEEDERKRKKLDEEEERRKREMDEMEAELERERKKLADKKLEYERQRKLKDDEHKKKLEKLKKKDYKIYFTVNIQTEENDESIIDDTSSLKPLLANLFQTKSEKDVFKIKTRKKGNGFKIDFGIIIATSMHPADYIDTFDDLTMDGSFQECIKEGFDMDNDPHVHIWEARYEKLDGKRKRNKK